MAGRRGRRCCPPGEFPFIPESLFHSREQGKAVRRKLRQRFSFWTPEEGDQWDPKVSSGEILIPEEALTILWRHWASALTLKLALLLYSSFPRDGDLSFPFLQDNLKVGYGALRKPLDWLAEHGILALEGSRYHYIVKLFRTHPFPTSPGHCKRPWLHKED